MKNILLILFIAQFVLQSNAQNEEIFSFYFDQEAVKNLPQSMQVNPRYFGKYELSDDQKYQIRKSAGEYLIVDENGIYLEKNRISHISREEVRENSQFLVRKGWLHGVVENDSIPCTLEDEDYYFLVPTKTFLFEKGIPPGRLVQFTSNTYAIFNYEDSGYFSSVVLTFNSGGVHIKDVEFSLDGAKNLSKVENVKKIEKKDNDFDTYILTPTEKEWKSFILVSCLNTYDKYVKSKEK